MLIIACRAGAYRNQLSETTICYRMQGWFELDQQGVLDAGQALEISRWMERNSNADLGGATYLFAGLLELFGRGMEPAEAEIVVSLIREQLGAIFSGQIDRAYRGDAAKLQRIHDAIASDETAHRAARRVLRR